MKLEEMIKHYDEQLELAQNTAAALRDLQKAINDIYKARPCSICKHYAGKWNEKCNECNEYVGAYRIHFEWRGK